MSIAYFFGHRTAGDDANDFFHLEYSTDGGTTFTDWVLIGDVTTVATWQNATVDVPGGSNVVVRVTVSDGPAVGDIVEGGIDDFTITPLVPTLSIDDYIIDEDVGSVDIVVTTIGNATTGPFTAFYQTNPGSAAGGGADFTDATGSINFNGTLGDSQIVTIPITDDSVVEGVEIFQFQINYTTDPSVIANDVSTITINDNDTVIITDGQTINRCDGVFFDSGGLFGLYENNEDITFTICPDQNGTVTNISFSTFDIQNNSDNLRVYQGTSTAGTLIGSYHNGNLPPANLTSSDVSELCC